MLGVDREAVNESFNGERLVPTEKLLSLMLSYKKPEEDLHFTTDKILIKELWQILWKLWNFVSNTAQHRSLRSVDKGVAQLPEHTVRVL